MTWSVTTPPTGEPITLAEAKTHLRVDADAAAEDALISGLITAARQHVEDVCERAVLLQSWTLRLDAFPRVCLGDVRASERGDDRIFLPGGLVSEVTSVKYTDSDGIEQTLGTGAYIANLPSDPARISPAYGIDWPTARKQRESVTVVYKVGYADAASVPAALKAAMLLIVGDLYANREASVAGQPLTDNRALARLLLPYKRIEP
jgi:uncharacterized phiE125 gp8 family phage protein